MSTASRTDRPRLRSARLELRPFRPEDVDDVFAYASDPVVTRAAGWEPHRTPMDTIAYIQQCMMPGWGPITCAIELRGEARVVGVVDLRVVSRFWGVGEIGYSLARPYWGRGLGSEAAEAMLDYGFEQLQLRRIRAVCRPQNRRSLATMRRLGMQPDPPLDPATTGGEVRLSYSIRRADWRRQAGERSFPFALAGSLR